MRAYPQRTTTTVDMDIFCILQKDWKITNVNIGYRNLEEGLPKMVETVITVNDGPTAYWMHISSPYINFLVRPIIKSSIKHKGFLFRMQILILRENIFKTAICNNEKSQSNGVAISNNAKCKWCVKCKWTQVLNIILWCTFTYLLAFPDNK